MSSALEAGGTTPDGASQTGRGRAARGGDTKQRIRAEALALFAEKGVDATSTREIAERVGVREGALYKHFRSKDDIVWDLFSSGYESYGEVVRAALAGPGTRAERLARTVRTICRLHDEDPALFRFLLLVQHGQLARLTPEMSNPVDHLLAFVAEGMAAGEVPDGDPVLMCSVLLGMVLQPATFAAYGRLGRGMADSADELEAACGRVLFGA